MIPAAHAPDQDRLLGLPAPWAYFLLGIPAAALFGALPLTAYMGWFLASLAHEMGHCAASWAFGMPAFPAISLAGDAAAVHGEQMVPLALLMWGGGIAFLWRLRSTPLRVGLLIAFALLYPALAFTDAKELVHLVAGHAAELAFAALCLHRAVTGGFTSSRVERGLYAMLGWLLTGFNAWLCLRLMFSEAGRRWYAGNGSFGLTNDYLRAADDVLGWPLQVVAFLMFVPAVGVVGFGLWCVLRQSTQAAGSGMGRTGMGSPVSMLRDI